MENMKFDAVLYNVGSFADALDGDGDMLRIEGLTKDEADTLCSILLKRKIYVCLFPIYEVEIE